MVINFLIRKILFNILVKLLFQFNRDFSKSLVYLDSSFKYFFVKNGIQGANKFAGVKIDGFVTGFEFVQFFQHHNRNNDIMFIKLINTGAVMKDNVGIQDKSFFSF